MSTIKREKDSVFFGNNIYDTAQTCSCVVGILAIEFLYQEEGNLLIGLGTFLYGIG